MKKILKSRIFMFIFGLVIASCIAGTVYAINASEITYKETTVDAALDDLYSKTINSKILLWENENPNDNITAIDINLNSSLTNFTHILIQYKVNTETSDIYEDLFNLMYERPNTNNINKAAFAIGAFDDATALIYRGVRVSDPVTLRLGNAVNTASVTKTNYLIPIAVYGLNLSY